MRTISRRGRESYAPLSPWRATSIGLAILGGAWILLESFGIAVSLFWHLFPAALFGSILYGGWRMLKRALFER